tara:strand:- start:53127 stop:53465 length:339 start_codon:yes stop_codon:yes gene_type:complete
VTDKLVDEILSLNDELFHLSILKYTNGYLVSVSEGKEPTLGSISLSLKQSNLVNTTIITPSLFSPMVPQLVSELASESSNGIGISSVYLTKDLKPDTAISIIEIIKSHLKKL